MRINPNGEEKTCKGFVSLFLYKDGVCEVGFYVATFTSVNRMIIAKAVFRIRYFFNGSGSDPKTKTDSDPGGKGPPRPPKIGAPRPP